MWVQPLVYEAHTQPTFEPPLVSSPLRPPCPSLLACAAAQVIDKKLIEDSVLAELTLQVSERASEKGSAVASSGKLDLPPLESITELRLSFKNIMHIDNLVGLHALTALRLDNNIIRCAPVADGEPRVPGHLSLIPLPDPLPAPRSQ